ncbi:MAG: hypothetical protein ACON5A_00820 [Candidatus Comchoanobacterales bacterium]
MRFLSWLTHFIISTIDTIAEFMEHFLEFLHHIVRSTAFHLVHSVLVIKCALVLTESSRKMYQLHNNKKTKSLFSKAIKSILLCLCVVGVIAASITFFSVGTEVAFALLALSQFSLMLYHSFRYGRSTQKLENAQSNEEKNKYKLKSSERLSQLKNASMSTILCSLIVISSLFFPIITTPLLIGAMCISAFHIVKMAHHFHENRMMLLSVEQPDQDILETLRDNLENLHEVTESMSHKLEADHSELYQPLNNRQKEHLFNSQNANKETDDEEEHETLGGP